VKALHVNLAMGGVLITEAHGSRCWHAEEVASVEIDVPADTRCDLCGELIEDEADE